jgi:hypothetical protein
MAQCTAKAKITGNQCRRSAVTGYSVCQVHGAGSVKQGRAGGAPVTTGRYSLKHRKALEEKQAQFLADPAPADLTGELALMRALLQDYLERYGDGTSLPASEIDRIFGMIREISQLVERIAKILNSTALTQAEVIYLQARIADLLTRYVTDPNDRQSFMAELSAPIDVRGGR